MRYLHYVLLFIVVISCAKQKDQNSNKSDDLIVTSANSCFNEFKELEKWDGNIELTKTVMFVHNTEKGLYNDNPQFSVNQDKTLAIDDDNTTMYAQKIAVDSEGNIYVSYGMKNTKYNIIRKYNSNGYLIQDLTLTNEIENLKTRSFLRIDNADNLIVCEYGYRKFQFFVFDKGGKLISRDSIPFNKLLLHDFNLKNKDFFLLTNAEIESNKVITIHKLSKDFKSRSEIYSKICQPLISVEVFSNSLTPYYAPYSSIRKKWDVNSKGCLYIADSPNYQISVYNQNGDIIKIVDRPDYSFQK